MARNRERKEGASQRVVARVGIVQGIARTSQDPKVSPAQVMAGMSHSSAAGNSHPVTASVANEDRWCPLPASDKKENSDRICQWIRENFEQEEGPSLQREVVYNFFVQFAKEGNCSMMNRASFGKLLRNIFPAQRVKVRRLGTRGQSKYHYAGLTVKKTSRFYGELIKIKEKEMNSCCAIGGVHKKEEDDDAFADYSVGLPSTSDAQTRYGQTFHDISAAAGLPSGASIATHSPCLDPGHDSLPCGVASLAQRTSPLSADSCTSVYSAGQSHGTLMYPNHAMPGLAQPMQSQLHGLARHGMNHPGSSPGWQGSLSPLQSAQQQDCFQLAPHAMTGSPMSFSATPNSAGAMLPGYPASLSVSHASHGCSTQLATGMAGALSHSSLHPPSQERTHSVCSLDGETVRVKLEHPSSEVPPVFAGVGVGPSPSASAVGQKSPFELGMTQQAQQAPMMPERPSLPTSRSPDYFSPLLQPIAAMSRASFVATHQSPLASQSAFGNWPAASERGNVFAGAEPMMQNQPPSPYLLSHESPTAMSGNPTDSRRESNSLPASPYLGPAGYSQLAMDEPHITFGTSSAFSSPPRPERRSV